MSDHPHPAHDHEARRLAITLNAIDEQVRSLRALGWSGGAAAHAAFQVQNWGWEKSDRLLRVRSSPYFGRIDIDGDEEEVETYYIGPEGLASPSGGQRVIVDWRAPISATFYRPDDRTRLKRRIDIKDARLVTLVDEHVRRVDCRDGLIDAQADPMLHGILSEARGGELGSIVRTLQAKQDELIRASDSIVVVQGAAGTGKTVVALHRLAYLLYQARSITSGEAGDCEAAYPASGRRIADRSAARSKVAVFGPNKTYLRHIRSVLPSLGEQDAIETTFEEWVWNVLRQEGLTARGTEEGLDLMLDASLPYEQRERVFRRAREKGRIEMGQVLTRYVTSALQTRLEALRTQPIRFVADVAKRPLSFEVRAPTGEIEEYQPNRTPLNGVRELVRQRMRQHVRDQVTGYLEGRGALEDGAGASRQYTAVLEQFDSTFERQWPRSSFVALYWNLLGDPAALRAAAVGTGIRLHWLQRGSSEVESEDIAALAYLRLLVDGPIPMRPRGESDARWTRLDHVVIDEAQDLSPLALAVVRAHADNLTVLGDMNQAIYAHRGTRSWSEVRRGLGNEVREIRTLNVSYRSTTQISELANHIVRVGSLEGGVSRPFPRTGADPCLQRASDQEQMREHVVVFVNESVSNESATIAILTRTAADARSWFATIGDRLVATVACITDRLDTQDARILILPAYLAKGIEFDAVAVVDVDKAAYSRTVHDATLLYVAVTRALHDLLVVWCGTPSPLIADQVQEA